jgi:hypothetical protein
MLAVSGFEPLFQESNSCVLTTALYRLTHDKKTRCCRGSKWSHFISFCFASTLSQRELPSFFFRCQL